MSSLGQQVTAWADRWWDERRGLLWNPPGSFHDEGLPPRSAHLVPQSGWYAGGLLQRGDVARAVRVLDELCALQYDQPGTAWHGTFARFAEWPEPTEGAVEWVDYDPNWRQFLGTTFSVLLRTFDLPADVVARLQAAIGRAVEGEPPGRVRPGYSNIALMKAWLDGDEVAAAEVVAAFDEHGAFEEYGSPTYYGIDLWALALWRRFPPSAGFARAGERLWAALWDDVVRWWHPVLQNRCGPYTRAYAMDVTRSAGLLGLWLPQPVVPPLGDEVHHGHDLTMAPLVELVGGGPQLRFDGSERVVEQRLPGGRVATGWLGPDAMAGGERGAHARAEGQYHPATAHWATADGTVGWLRLRHAGPLWATAEEGRLVVEVRDSRSLGRRPVRVESSSPGRFEPSAWTFGDRRVAYEGPPAGADGVIDAGAGDVLVLSF
jgi:hypothetical protein